MAPMRAAGIEWARQGPRVEIEWHARSGLCFAEQPIEELAVAFDLISIDHPFVGQASINRCLAPLDELLPAERLAALAADAIGASHLSYAYAGHQWALAADSACQVAVVRDDLLGPRSVPRTWDEVLELGREAPGRVTMSLEPHQAMCSFLSLCANAGRPVPATRERFADAEMGRAAVEWLLAFAQRCHPGAWHDFVPERMSRTDECLYCPLQFGYSTFSRPGFTGRRLRFEDIPSAGSGPIGSTLGGAGLAVSALSAHPHEAAAFAAWVTGPTAQVEVVVPNGGQPGSRAAWRERELDAEVGGFFSGTLATMERAVVRPTDPWWPSFQRDGGALLSRCLRDQADPDTILAGLEQAWQASFAPG